MPEEERTNGKWLRSFQFMDMRSAGQAYQRARDIVFRSEIDASVYRIQIRGVPHVISMGDGLLTEELRKEFEGACVGGKAVDIPADVARTLLERRAANRLPGSFWEANYRPGTTASTGRRMRAS